MNTCIQCVYIYIRDDDVHRNHLQSNVGVYLGLNHHLSLNTKSTLF